MPKLDLRLQNFFHTQQQSMINTTSENLKASKAGLKIRACNWKLLSYFSTKTYVVGTQKNRLDESVLLSTQNTRLNWQIRK